VFFFFFCRSVPLHGHSRRDPPNLSRPAPFGRVASQMELEPARSRLTITRCKGKMSSWIGSIKVGINWSEVGNSEVDKEGIYSDWNGDDPEDAWKCDKLGSWRCDEILDSEGKCTWDVSNCVESGKLVSDTWIWDKFSWGNSTVKLIFKERLKKLLKLSTFTHFNLFSEDLITATLYKNTKTPVSLIVLKHSLINRLF